MQTLRNIKAPAKVNLFLHVVGQREDGYHLLQSAFMFIDWFDILHFKLRLDGKITRTDLTKSLPKQDLCTQAATLLQNYSNCSLGADIQIDKQIPSQAGLGGGSSDAAACLLALRKLWNLPITLAQLQQLGIKLGADVPFFLQPHNAWAQGIGEQLTPIPLPNCQLLICKPLKGVSTPSIFASTNLPRNSSENNQNEFLTKPFAFGNNDLQTVACKLNPDIKQAIQLLQQYGLTARMTGSGSAVFAILDSTEKQRLAKKIFTTKHEFSLKLCNNLHFHNLMSLLDDNYKLNFSL